MEPRISCSLNISFIFGRIFIKLWSVVCLNWMIGRIHHSNHANLRSRSQLNIASWSVQFCICSISPLPLEGFSLKFWLNVCHSMVICIIHISTLWLKVKVTIEGHEFEPLIFFLAPYLLYIWKDYHKILVKCFVQCDNVQNL